MSTDTAHHHIDVIDTKERYPSTIRDEASRIVTEAKDTPPFTDTNNELLTSAALLLSQRTPTGVDTPLTTYLAHVTPYDLSTIRETAQLLATSPIDTPSYPATIDDIVTGIQLVTRQKQPTTAFETIDGLDDYIEQHGDHTIDDTDFVFHHAALTVLFRAYITHVAHDEPLPKSSATYEQNVSFVLEHSDTTVLPPKTPIDAVTSDFTDEEIGWLSSLTTHLSVTHNPSELIGDLYESLFDNKSRHQLGQFRTPPHLSSLIASLASIDGDNTVYSPGIGAGSITSAVVSRLSHETDNPLDRIIGDDISPLSILMGGAALTALNVDGSPELVQRDVLLSQDLPTNVDVVVSNPPYTKHHDIPSETKHVASTQLKSITGESISALSPAYVYFTLKTLPALTTNGRAVFLTPTEVLNTEYGTTWKQHLIDNYQVDAFIKFDRSTQNNTEFDTALSTSLLTVLTNTPPDETHETVFIDIRGDYDEDRVVEATFADAEHTPAVNNGTVTTYPQASLEPAGNWELRFSPEEQLNTDSLTPFHEIGDVRRGIATGQNSYFCLSESDRTGAYESFEWDIDQQYLTPIIRRSAFAPHYDFTHRDWEQHRDNDDPVWLLYHVDTARPASQTTLSNEQSDDVNTYIEYGVRKPDPVDETYLGSSRDPWYRVERTDPPDIFYTSMSRGDGRFIWNKARVRNLNNLHGIYLDDTFSEEDTKALLAYLNSPITTSTMQSHGRTLATGMNKTEPGDIVDLPVIHPHDLSANEKTRLASLFDALRDASRSSNDNVDAVKRQIEDFVQSFVTPGEHGDTHSQ